MKNSPTFAIYAALVGGALISCTEDKFDPDELMKQDFEQLEEPILEFRRDMGRYPRDQERLDVLTN